MQLLMASRKGRKTKLLRTPWGKTLPFAKPGDVTFIREPPGKPGYHFYRPRRTPPYHYRNISAKRVLQYLSLRHKRGRKPKFKVSKKERKSLKRVVKKMSLAASKAWAKRRQKYGKKGRKGKR